MRGLRKAGTQTEIVRAIAASKTAAEKLTRVGMRVILRNDAGAEVLTKLTRLPWAGAAGQMLCETEYKPGRAWSCMRVQLAPCEEVAA